MTAQTGRRSAFVILTAAMLFGTVEVAAAFQRNITFCNRTREPLTVAIGYDRTGTTRITSSGWYRVASCACRTILRADLRATEFFLLTTKVEGTAPLVEGRAPLCVHPRDEFTYVSQNVNQAACTRAGGRWVNFAFHDTGTNTNFTVNFRFEGASACNL
jgi:uncharacterized membrane protein